MVVIKLFLCLPCFAGDHAFVFQEEYYNETTPSSSNTPVIYHSLQIMSQAGPKLIILTGDHPNRRKWLRQYLAEDRLFMALVPDTDNDRFIQSNIFEIDIRRIHPMGSTDSPAMKKLAQSILNPQKKQTPSRNQVQPDTTLETKSGRKKPDPEEQAGADKAKTDALAAQALKASKETEAEKEKAKALQLARQALEESKLEAQALLQLAEDKARKNLLNQRLREAELRWLEQAKNLNIRENETAQELEKRLQEIEIQWRETEKMRKHNQ